MCLWRICVIGSLGYGEDRPASPQLFSAAGGVRTLRTPGILALRSERGRVSDLILRLVPYMPLDAKPQPNFSICGRRHASEACPRHAVYIASLHPNMAEHDETKDLLVAAARLRYAPETA